MKTLLITLTFFCFAHPSLASAEGFAMSNGTYSPNAGGLCRVRVSGGRYDKTLIVTNRRRCHDSGKTIILDCNSNRAGRPCKTIYAGVRGRNKVTPLTKSRFKLGAYIYTK